MTIEFMEANHMKTVSLNPCSNGMTIEYVTGDIMVRTEFGVLILVLME